MKRMSSRRPVSFHAKWITFLFALAPLCATPAPPPLQLFVDARAPGSNDGTSWPDAFTDLQSALEVATVAAAQGAAVEIDARIVR